MTGIGVRFDIKRDEVSPVLAALLARGDDLTPVHRDIGASMLFATQRRFELEEDPEGNPWPKSIRAMAEGGTTLRDSNRLYSSLSFNASKSGVEWGTDVIYGAIHQDGGKTGRGHKVTMPRRAYLGVNEENQNAIVEAYEDFLRAPGSFGVGA